MDQEKVETISVSELHSKLEWNRKERARLEEIIKQKEVDQDKFMQMKTILASVQNRAARIKVPAGKRLDKFITKSLEILEGAQNG